MKSTLTAALLLVSALSASAATVARETWPARTPPMDGQQRCQRTPLIMSGSLYVESNKPAFAADTAAAASQPRQNTASASTRERHPGRTAPVQNVPPPAPAL